MCRTLVGSRPRLQTGKFSNNNITSTCCVAVSILTSTCRPPHPRSDKDSDYGRLDPTDNNGWGVRKLSGKEEICMEQTENALSFKIREELSDFSHLFTVADWSHTTAFKLATSYFLFSKEETRFVNSSMLLFTRSAPFEALVTLVSATLISLVNDFT
jgi:hypothetical protein